MMRVAFVLAAFAATSISVESSPRRMARPADQDGRAVFRRLQLRHHRTHRRRSKWASASASRWWSRTASAARPSSAPTAVAKSAADGYTLLLANTTTHAASAALNATLPFDPVKDFAPVAMIGVSPFVLIGATQVAAPTLAGFRRAGEAKARLAQLRLRRHRNARASGGRVVQAQGRCRCHPCAVSRQRTVDDRPDAGPHRSFGQHHPADAPAYPRRQAARFRHHEREAQRHAAGHSDRGRGRRPGLRGRAVDRDRRAGRRARRHHQTAQCRGAGGGGDARDPAGAHDPGRRSRSPARPRRSANASRPTS